MKNRDIPADAEATAVAVLGWLANEPEMLSRFLALSGVQPTQLRQAVGDPAFLAGMLEFLMQHEPTLMEFCTATDTKPETVVEAYHRYAGPSFDSVDF
ncbi:DUF3572 domain-containing protein [Allorhizobium sp. NPDC080224]|uniref:DUF3572 domain-containing protein n=1 Tax=Allorhizobium sp. NPDC080224 TaxID=3390547 RepID=UPI003D014B4A